MSSDLASAKGTKTIFLTTNMRDGTAAGAPVSLALDGDRAFFRSYNKAGKTKRLRNNPWVEFAASTLRGKPMGPPVHARAPAGGRASGHRRQGTGATSPCVAGDPRSLAHRIMHYQTMHYGLRPNPVQASPGADAT